FATDVVRHARRGEEVAFIGRVDEDPPADLSPALEANRSYAPVILGDAAVAIEPLPLDELDLGLNEHRPIDRGRDLRLERPHRVRVAIDAAPAPIRLR